MSNDLKQFEELPHVLKSGIKSRTNFENIMTALFDTRQLSTRTHEEMGFGVNCDKVFKMTLYYYNDVHIGTWHWNDREGTVFTYQSYLKSLQQTIKIKKNLDKIKQLDDQLGVDKK